QRLHRKGRHRNVRPLARGLLRRNRPLLPAAVLRIRFAPAVVLRELPRAEGALQRSGGGGGAQFPQRQDRKRQGVRRILVARNRKPVEAAVDRGAVWLERLGGRVRKRVEDE